MINIKILKIKNFGIRRVFSHLIYNCRKGDNFILIRIVQKEVVKTYRSIKCLEISKCLIMTTL